MSVRSVLNRIKDDLGKFEDMSYSDVHFGYEVLDLDEFLKDPEHDTQYRLVKREYTVDNAKVAIKLYDKRPGRVITLNQIRDIFDNMGFNVDATISEIHHADILLVYNIGGYLIPFYKILSELVTKVFPNMKYAMQTKLAPGIKRLHARLYHNFDGSWLLITHIDEANWMNLFNPIQLFISHGTAGSGNYIVGSKLMVEFMKVLASRFEKKESFFIDIEQIYKGSPK